MAVGSPDFLLPRQFRSFVGTETGSILAGELDNAFPDACR